MNKKLLIEALSKYIIGVIMIGVLMFVPANSFHYWNGWLFMGLLFIPMFFAGIIMMVKNPDLLRLRLSAKEKESEQKEVILLSGIMFITGFILAGINYRMNWIKMPNLLVIIGSIIFFLSYLLYFEVLRENSSLSRTIDVNKNQKLVDTGLYGIIRHPMYFATVFMFLSIPFILNSLITFFIFLIYPYIMVKRIKNEEQVLEKKLKGYKEYQKKVKYKMIPFIW